MWFFSGFGIHPTREEKLHGSEVSQVLRLTYFLPKQHDLLPKKTKQKECPRSTHFFLWSFFKLASLQFFLDITTAAAAAATHCTTTSCSCCCCSCSVRIQCSFGKDGRIVRLVIKILSHMTFFILE